MSGSIAAVINAVKNGLGIAAAPCFAVHGMGSIVRLTPDVVAAGEAFLVTPHRETVRVRIVMDAMIAVQGGESAARGH